jgi:hypothetical protein
MEPSLGREALLAKQGTLNPQISGSIPGAFTCVPQPLTRSSMSGMACFGGPTLVVDREGMHQGDVAEWLRTGLQPQLYRFDSGRRLCMIPEVVGENPTACFAPHGVAP